MELVQTGRPSSGNYSHRGRTARLCHPHSSTLVRRLQRLFLTGTRLMKIFNVRLFFPQRSTLPVTAACRRMYSFQRTTVRSPLLECRGRAVSGMSENVFVSAYNRPITAAPKRCTDPQGHLYRPDYFPQDPRQFEPVHRPTDPRSVYMGIPGNFSTPYPPDHTGFRASVGGHFSRSAECYRAYEHATSPVRSGSPSRSRSDSSRGGYGRSASSFSSISSDSDEATFPYPIEVTW